MPIKIKTIFCPVDIASEGAESLYLPLCLAQDFGAKLILCYCANASSPAKTKKQNAQKLNELINEAREKFPLETGEFLPFTNVLVLDAANNIAGKITCAAAAVGADLTIMRPSRHPLFKSLTFGSIVEKVIRRAPCPVLIVESGKSRSPDNFAAPKFRRILAAHDFSDYSEIALQYACYFAKKHAARLDLLHVLEDPIRHSVEPGWAGEIVEHLYHQTIKRLQIAAKSCELELTGKTVPFARWGRVYREVLKFSEENEIDLIAMGERGADFSSKSLFGSNVERVLRQTSCAVLIARHIKRECPLSLREFPRPNE